MKQGTKVKLSGTKKEGVVIETTGKRDHVESNVSTILFVKVKWNDGSEGEYVVNELRKIE